MQESENERTNKRTHERASERTNETKERGEQPKQAEQADLLQQDKQQNPSLSPESARLRSPNQVLQVRRLPGGLRKRHWPR